MVGSIDDADDLVQETLLAAWRGLDGFGGRASLRAWLYRIATNRCLNAIRDGKRRPPLAPRPPFDAPEPNGTVDVTWLQPYPDARAHTGGDGAAHHESGGTIELAFVRALQLLPPRQTAALVLCDVVGFAAAEVADMLGTSPVATKGLLQRARATVDRSEATPMGSQDVDRSPTARLAERFAAAFAADDVDGVVALLTDDAWLAMPPAPHRYLGPAAIDAFLRASASWRAHRRYTLVPTSANRQPAFGCYLPEADGAVARATGIVVLTVGDGAITGVSRFLDPDLHRHFGLADVVPPGVPDEAGPLSS
jgi:RNA polymerase sigma-70 factor (ECF subfamily)